MSGVVIAKCPFCHAVLPKQGERCPQCKRPWEDLVAAWEKDHKQR